MPYWKWEPSACRLEEVDEAKFCRVMKGRKGLLFAGESHMVRGGCWLNPARSKMA